MIRTTIAVLILVAAVFWLPFWAQIALLVIGVLLVPHRLALFIPAAIADALYAPGSMWSIHTHRYVLLVVGMLIVYTLIITYTRAGELYGVEK